MFLERADGLYKWLYMFILQRPRVIPSQYIRTKQSMFEVRKDKKSITGKRSLSSGKSAQIWSLSERWKNPCASRLSRIRKKTADDHPDWRQEDHKHDQSRRRRTLEAMCGDLITTGTADGTMHSTSVGAAVRAYTPHFGKDEVNIIFGAGTHRTSGRTPQEVTV